MGSLSLKSRIVLTLVVLVTLSSGIFAAGLFLLKERVEGIAFGNMVRNQMSLILDQVEQGETIDNLLLTGWQYYAGEKISSLPAVILDLPEGSHHSVSVDEKYYQVEVIKADLNPAFLTYDISEWENQEHAMLRLLAYGVVFIFLAAIAVGVYLARMILSPLNEMTARLASIEPDERHVKIASEFHGNDLAPIAAAFDHYMERLDKFVEREKFFTAAASHELRTPLSVVMGAVDVLEAQGIDPVQQPVIERIKRAVAEMQGFIEATLLLAREGSVIDSQEGLSDVTQIVKKILVQHSNLMQQKQIAVATEFTDKLLLSEPEKIVQMVVNNILVNAIDHTSKGEIKISIDSQQLRIEDSGEGIKAPQLSRVFDQGFTTKRGGSGTGLSLVKRICDRFRWSIDIQSENEQGTKVTVNFSRNLIEGNNSDI